MNADYYMSRTRAAPTSENDGSDVTVSGTVPLFNHYTDQFVAASKSPVCVEYNVARDAELKEIVDCGTAYTSSDIDYTIKVIYVLPKPIQ